MVFTLLEHFHGEVIYDQNVASFLELMRIPYTGCNPRGLVLARGKDLSKTLVHYHRIAVPAFAVFPIGRKVRRPHAPRPAADRQERERGRLDRHLAGFGRRYRREARGARRLHPRARSAQPPSPSNTSRDASSMSGCSATTGCGRCRSGSCHSARWPRARGTSRPRRSSTIPAIRSAGAYCRDRPRTFPRPVCARIQRTAKRIYRTLELDGYARIDFRLAADGTLYFLEANPNPEIAESQEFATAALHDGLSYSELLHRIVALGMQRAAASMPS